MQAELPKGLHYHSVEHTIDVIEAAIELAKFEELEDHELNLLVVSAIFHDFGFIISMQDHEKHSCTLADQYLPEYNFSKEEIDQVKQAIMATKIPQSPTNRIGELLCDADLDYLGRADFSEIAQRLYIEINETVRPIELNEWNKIQIGFIENHHYFTQTNQKRREQTKQQHLQHLKTLIV